MRVREGRDKLFPLQTTAAVRHSGRIRDLQCTFIGGYSRLFRDPETFHNGGGGTGVVSPTLPTISKLDRAQTTGLQAFSQGNTPPHQKRCVSSKLFCLNYLSWSHLISLKLFKLIWTVKSGPEILLILRISF